METYLNLIRSAYAFELLLLFFNLFFIGMVTIIAVRDHRLSFKKYGSVCDISTYIGNPLTRLKRTWNDDTLTMLGRLFFSFIDLVILLFNVCYIRSSYFIGRGIYYLLFKER